MDQSNLPEGCSAERIELLKKRISGWVRQSRYRSRKTNVIVDVTFPEVVEIYEQERYSCVYCGKIADSPDHPFPIAEHGPCVPANIVPCCNECRDKKGNRNIVKLYRDHIIPEAKLHEILKTMLRRKGGEDLRSYIKSIYIPKDTTI